MQLTDLFASLVGLLPQSLLEPSSFNADASCSNPGLSCPIKTPSDVDTCCMNTPSGHFLLTQFWDASPALGSPTNWTTHGLWPDLCAGGFDQFCDRRREHSDITSILSSSPELLSYMQTHWLSLNGDNNHLWSHEWNKHGTCISTLEPPCYPSSDNGLEAVVSYFTHAATLYSTLNTYATLAAADIVPSHDKTYSLDDLQNALTFAHGHPVTFRCHGSQLQEIWYHYLTRGSLRNARSFNLSLSTTSPTKDLFVPTNPDVAKSNCPITGIRYLPKDAQNPAPTHTTGRPTHHPSSTSQPTSTSRPFSGRGHLRIRVLSPSDSSTTDNIPSHRYRQQQQQQQPLSLSASATDTTGCLIRSGQWYTSGSCATYLAKTDPPHFPLSSNSDSDSDSGSDSDADAQSGEHLFTLSSLYAPCAVMPTTSDNKDDNDLASAPGGHGGAFMCGKDLGIQAIFEGVNVTRSEGDDGKGKELTREVLAYKGDKVFYAEKVPGRFEKGEIFVDDDNGKRGVRVQVEWEGI